MTTRCSSLSLFSFLLSPLESEGERKNDIASKSRGEARNGSRVIDQPKKVHSHDFVTEAKPNVTNREREEEDDDDDVRQVLFLTLYFSSKWTAK